jgi:hypothetical protein
MSWLKKLKKSVRHISEEFSDITKPIVRKVANVVQIGAPVVGSMLLGPLGGAIGTAVGLGASQVGPNKNRTAALKRTLFSGAAVTAGFAGLGALSGAGLAAPGIASIQNLFGGGAPQPQSPEGANVPANVSARNMAGGRLISTPGGPVWVPNSLPASVATKGDPNAAATGLRNSLFGGIASFTGNAQGPSGQERSGINAGGLGDILNQVLNPDQQGQGGVSLGNLLPFAVLGLVAYAAFKGKKAA